MYTLMFRILLNGYIATAWRPFCWRTQGQAPNYINKCPQFWQGFYGNIPSDRKVKYIQWVCHIIPFLRIHCSYWSYTQFQGSLTEIKPVNNIFRIKMSCSKLVSTRRSTVLRLTPLVRLPCQIFFLASFASQRISIRMLHWLYGARTPLSKGPSKN